MPDVIGLEVVSTQGVMVTLTMDADSMTTIDLQGPLHFRRGPRKALRELSQGSF